MVYIPNYGALNVCMYQNGGIHFIKHHNKFFFITQRLKRIYGVWLKEKYPREISRANEKMLKMANVQDGIIY